MRLADAGRARERLFIAVEHRQRQPIRRVGRKNRQRRLRPDAGNTEQQLKAVLLALAGKTVKIMCIFADDLVSIELDALAGSDAADRVQAGVERVADPAALQHDQIRFDIGNDTVYVVEHGSNFSC